MPPKRKRRDNNNNDEDAQQPARKRDTNFATLKPRIRHISEQTIKSKWTTLPESTQGKIKELFLSVELPVITRQRDEKKRTEVQSALATVRKKYVTWSIPDLSIDLFGADSCKVWENVSRACPFRQIRVTGALIMNLHCMQM